MNTIFRCCCDACIGGTIHASDCAVHNAPTLSVGPCDCSAGEIADLQAEIERLTDALAASEARDVGELGLPNGFHVKRVEGHGWTIDPPSGARWVAFEETPVGELLQALATRASEATPVAVGGAKSARVEIPQEVIQQQDSLMHPATQVFFRAGLLACREYMAGFAQHDSPIIAASIRANWWPSLGQDFGPPRKLNWSELTEGESGEDGFRAKTADEISPTQEALPIALQFLQSLDPAYGRATIGTEGIERSIKRGVAALASQAAPDTATTVYNPEFVRNKFADYETQILNLREELAARVGSQAVLSYPEELTPELREVLGWICFQCISVAQCLRADGMEIAKRAEDEQAAVLHWLTKFVLKHGAEWRPHAGEALKAMRERVAQRDASKAEGQQP